MNISSRTPEGDDNRCGVCGHDFRLEPSRPAGDAPCPNCGSLVWFLPAAAEQEAAPARAVVHGTLHSEGAEDIVLSGPQLVMGRATCCDIRLTSPKASNLHCVLSFANGYWEIRDLMSKNGVQVNGEKVTQAVLLPGDKITIARTCYTISYSLPEEAASMTA